MFVENNDLFRFFRPTEENGRLIEVYAEVGLPSSTTTEPFIVRTYPSDYCDKKILSNVPNFAYPCQFKWYLSVFVLLIRFIVLLMFVSLCSDTITCFSFVLTNINSKWTFGYCRHTPGWSTCQVILSDLPWHFTFYKILNHCAELSMRSVRFLMLFIQLNQVLSYHLVVNCAFRQLFASIVQQRCSSTRPANKFALHK